MTIEKWSHLLFYLLGTQKGAKAMIRTVPTMIKPFNLLLHQENRKKAISYLYFWETLDFRTYFVVLHRRNCSRNS